MVSYRYLDLRIGAPYSLFSEGDLHHVIDDLVLWINVAAFYLFLLGLWGYISLVVLSGALFHCEYHFPFSPFLFWSLFVGVLIHPWVTLIVKRYISFVVGHVVLHLYFLIWVSEIRCSLTHNRYLGLSRDHFPL